MIARVFLCFFLVAQAANAAELRGQIAKHLTGQFERVGRRAPELDPTLDAAAGALAKEALEMGTAQTGQLWAITEAVSSAGGFYASPKALILRASSPEAALDALVARTDLAEDPASVFGVGEAVARSGAAVVVLMAERKARLEAFPRVLHSPSKRPVKLCGELAEPLGRGELFITQPNGTVRKSLTQLQGRRFCGAVPLSLRGRYTVEVLGHGPRGPEVAALFFVDVGATAGKVSVTGWREPTTAEEAREELLSRINALRAAHREKPLVLDPRLSQVAQQYSERMSKESFFAHVAPDGADIRQRLERAGYPFRSAGENLGLAEGPIAAHFGIEHSPGHRRQLIAREFTHVGLGIAFGEHNGRKQAWVTEVFAAPRAASKDPLADAYRSVFAKRASLGLPALIRSGSLERLAVEAAEDALRRNDPNSRSNDLHRRIFEDEDNAARASVDLFIADHPSLVVDSKNLADARNTHVGIGAVRGDSPLFGKGKYWVVVIYAGMQ